MSELSIHTDTNHGVGFASHGRSAGRSGYGLLALDPYAAVPGQVPFADHLRAVNETDRSASGRGRDRHDLVSARRGAHQDSTPRVDLRQGSGAILDATLGEVLDVEQRPKAPTYTRGGDIARISLAGHAGRVIDVVV